MTSGRAGLPRSSLGSRRARPSVREARPRGDGRARLVTWRSTLEELRRAVGDSSHRPRRRCQRRSLGRRIRGRCLRVPRSARSRLRARGVSEGSVSAGTQPVRATRGPELRAPRGRFLRRERRSTAVRPRLRIDRRRRFSGRRSWQPARAADRLAARSGEAPLRSPRG